MNRVELSILVGDLEKLKIAIDSGADAVYIGGEFFGTKSLAKNFTKKDLEDGVNYTHQNGKKIYATINVMPHNDDFKNLEEYLLYLERIGIDAVILADPGVLTVVKKVIPNMDIHLNTQANTTNYASANFWYDQGVKRVIVSKELSFEEVSHIREKTPSNLEIEALVHGAMCISYSGRCLITNYMTGKNGDKNLSDGSDEWKYYLEEEKRPGEYFPIYEDEKGTFFFNSKDLCLIEYIPELIKSGITSLKIESRKQTNDYIKAVVEAYKDAIDEFYRNSSDWKVNPSWIEEMKKVGNRDFTTGFYVDGLDI